MEKKYNSVLTENEKKQLDSLIKKGFSQSVIAQKLNLKQAFVLNYIETYHKKRKCQSCIYTASGQKGGCDYILVEGKSRRCNAAYCTKYVKGKAIKKIKNPSQI